MRSRRATCGPSSATFARRTRTGCSTKPTRADGPAQGGDMRVKLAGAIALLTIALAGCRLVPEVETPPVPIAANALTAGLKAGPTIASLGLRSSDAASAL